jgi:hypothetical protein
MPDLRRPSAIRASGISSPVRAPRASFQPYRYLGWEFDPIPGEPTPREIVTRLHAEIAAKSPGHAALVSMFTRLCGGPPSWDPDGDYAEDRVRTTRGAKASREKWRELRLAGVSKADARTELGVSVRTAGRYENWLETAGRRAA